MVVLRWCCCLAAIVLVLARYGRAEKLSLDGIWTAVNANLTINISASVPGGIHTDLKNNGLIGEPYQGFGDVRYTWVALENWTFHRTFQVTEQFLDHEEVTLVAQGIDTVCQVVVNGILLTTTRNMFVRYSIPVKMFLKAEPETNTISLKCESPVTYAKQKSDFQTRFYTVYPVCPPTVQYGQCHVNFIRKTQSSFSWDWGPSFPSQGIWKSIGLEAYDEISTIRDVAVATHFGVTPSGTDEWTLGLDVFLECAFKDPKEAAFWVSLEDSLLSSGKVLVKPIGKGEATFHLNVTVPTDMGVQRWWPNGYGDQVLYALNVTVSVGRELSTKTVRIGFRTVELVQDDVVLDPSTNKSEGLDFYFKINDVPIFAKGSNWIPADSFPERITKDYLEHLLRSAKIANMNMFRVWGGGRYEADEFYELADELGILIWQDFMFAVSLYPVDDDFLDTVKTEVQQQVRRLHHHPSIVLWAGNNENEQAIASLWWPLMLYRYQRYKDDYRTLYIDVIKTIVDSEDNTRPFLASSPTNGKISEQEGWIAASPNSNSYGDAHFYNYALDWWHPSASMPTARFVSEYGLQSYPSRDTLETAIPSSMLVYPLSAALEHRQHQMFGSQRVERAIQRHFKFPPKLGKSESFDAFWYLSQIEQAVGIKTATELFRRLRGHLDAYGDGNTMGALYWQFNDIWQAPSWASIEYGGRWKMLHYFAKRFFSPVLVSPYIDQGYMSTSLKIYVVNDLRRQFEDVRVNVLVYRWSSLTPVRSLEIALPVALPNETSLHVFTGTTADLWSSTNCTDVTCFVRCSLKDQSGSSLGPDNYVLPKPPKSIAGLQNATLKVTNVSGPSPAADGTKTFELTLVTDNVALFVWLSSHDVSGQFSDNGFIMSQPTMTLQFDTREGVTSEELAAKITVQSVSDYV